MAVEVAAQMLWLAKWFHDEVRANPGVKAEVKAVAECVDRFSAMLQMGAGREVLDNPRGLHHAHLVLQHVCQCLHDAKVFYEKYKHGWGTRVSAILCTCVVSLYMDVSARAWVRVRVMPASATSRAEFPRKRWLKMVDHTQSDHRKGQGPAAPAPGTPRHT